jgi:predicted 3-demethylubiquinone-9 3-methyltransferase (glyoxalase superfamily)
MKRIGSCLWFDNQGEEAAKFYSTVFNTKIGTVARYGESGAKASGQKQGSVMWVDLQIEDQWVGALNGGPIFKHNQSFSFFVKCHSEEEITRKWKALSEGGTVRMGLDKYPWAERYGWTTDKYGIEWQLMYSPDYTKSGQKVEPSFLFVNKLFGKGKSAVDFYTSIFPNSKIESIAMDEKTNTVMHCEFSLSGNRMALMEGQGDHKKADFSEAFSLMVECDTQQEIDNYWSKLTADGGVEGPCGWLKDKFGVSWQIVTSDMDEYMKDPVKGEKAMKAILTMKKPDLAKIKAAMRG